MPKKLFIAISFVMAKCLITQMPICRRLAAICIVCAALRKNGGDLKWYREVPRYVGKNKWQKSVNAGMKE